MSNLIKIILLCMFSLNGNAQIYFGTSHQYEKAKIFKKIDSNYFNNITIRDPELGFLICKKDHQKIQDLVLAQYNKNIGLVLYEINELSKKNEFNGPKKSYFKQVLMDQLMNYVAISEMKNELEGQDLKTKVFNKQLVFNYKYLNVNLEKYFEKALDAASRYHFNHSFPGWLLESIKTTLITDITKTLIKNSFKAVVNGVAIDFTKKVIAGAMTEELLSAGLKRASLSFTKGILISAGKGLLIEILTTPLKGGRPAPESMWLDLLEDYPGIILNPELMKEAGIQDRPWMTHCNTINRRAHSIEMKIQKLLKTIEEDVSSQISFARYAGAPIEDEYRTGARMPIDNTATARPRVPKFN